MTKIFDKLLKKETYQKEEVKAMLLGSLEGCSKRFLDELELKLKELQQRDQQIIEWEQRFDRLMYRYNLTRQELLKRLGYKEEDLPKFKPLEELKQKDQQIEELKRFLDEIRDILKIHYNKTYLFRLNIIYEIIERYKKEVQE